MHFKLIVITQSSNNNDKFNISTCNIATTYHHVAPATRQTGDAVICLNAFATLGAAAVAIAIDPVVQHVAAAFGFLCFHVGGDAGGRCTLHATFVNRIFAYCICSILL